MAGAFVTTTDDVTGAVTRTTTPATTFFPDLASMASELKASYEAAFQKAGSDDIGRLAGIAPVGEAFQRAVDAGVATRDMWAADATTDGLIDLWFDDGTHASRYGSYLAALTLFGTLTRIDPWSFGANEEAAHDLDGHQRLGRATGRDALLGQRRRLAARGRIGQLGLPRRQRRHVACARRLWLCVGRSRR